MDRRGGYAPMEFEYDNKHGSVDPTSPFFTAAMKSPPIHFGERQNSFTSQPPPSTPKRANSGPSVFSNAPQFKTPLQNRDSFKHLRDNISNDFDFSSGAENMSSPENADNEDTPEPPLRTASPSKINANVTVFRGKQSPTKEKPSSSTSTSYFGGNRIQKSGKGLFARGNRSRHDSKQLIHHGKRRRVESSTDLSNWRLEESDDENDWSRPSSRDGPGQRSPRKNSASYQKQHPEEIGFFSLLTYLETHPRLPVVLSYYLQLLVNVLVVAAAFYLAYSCYSTIRQDVDIQSEHAIRELMLESATCRHAYTENRCGGADQPPVMVGLCENWLKCMNRDPKRVGRARMSAETFAGIYNAFVEPISYKAMIFFFTTFFGSLAISNFAFGYFRARLNQGTHASPAHPQQHQYQQQQSFQQQAPSQPQWMQQSPMRHQVQDNYFAAPSPQRFKSADAYGDSGESSQRRIGYH
ncbi:hypothetical protein MMC25_000272 [Agyrium rufum]|nr:hypothetical protein [Agyrium rufum]